MAKPIIAVGAVSNRTYRSIPTGKGETAVPDADGVGYQETFVDIETGRAAQVGDILEVLVQSPNPSLGLHPVQHTVTAEDVKRSHIQSAELIAYEISAKTVLLFNYPNPFNPETWIPYRLAKDATVQLSIYDQRGRMVRQIDVGYRIAAAYERPDKAIYWDERNKVGERVASGIYFYTLTTGDYSATRTMVIVNTISKYGGTEKYVDSPWAWPTPVGACFALTHVATR